MWLCVYGNEGFIDDPAGIGFGCLQDTKEDYSGPSIKRTFSRVIGQDVVDNRDEGCYAVDRRCKLPDSGLHRCSLCEICHVR